MRRINKIIIHCSASDDPAHDNLEVIKDLHTSPPSKVFKWGKYTTNGRGWVDVGYHFFISKNGVLFNGRSEDIIGAHVRGHNRDSIGICLSGERGLPTAEQEKTLESICKDLCKRYALSKMDIIGHNDLDNKKTCPNFDVHELVSSWDWH